MDYIVMDLEWNQCPYGKGNEAKGLPFEIIEIGAVKLNEDFEIIDKFSEIIKPRIYKQLHLPPQNNYSSDPVNFLNLPNFFFVKLLVLYFHTDYS